MTQDIPAAAVSSVLITETPPLAPSQNVVRCNNVLISRLSASCLFEFWFWTEMAHLFEIVVPFLAIGARSKDQAKIDNFTFRLHYRYVAIKDKLFQ